MVAAAGGSELSSTHCDFLSGFSVPALTLSRWCSTFAAVVAVWEKSDEMEALSGLDLVDPVFPRFGESGKTRVFLTEAGQRYIAILARKRRKETRRYWITTAIAIAALVVSVISLIKQQG